MAPWSHLKGEMSGISQAAGVEQCNKEHHPYVGLVSTSLLPSVLILRNSQRISRQTRAT